jgi:predicted molibdopterin-dependent oxidoreductase YjgC
LSNSNSYITALIDGEPVRVRSGLTVLDAARRAGIYIPTLCYLERLKAYGGCRLCVVEIKGKKGYPTACTTPLEPGMEITTKTRAIQSLRRSVLELTLSEHPYTCLVCGDRKECGEFMHTTRKAGTITGCNFCTSNGDCELQDLIDYLDLSDVRYPIAYRGIKPDRENPFYDLDYNLCILCGRCVRVCNEERNSNVLAFVQRGNSTIVGTAFGDSQTDAGCEFCGACIDVCPTGSISGKMGKWAGMPDRSTETTCTLCSVGCTMNVNTRGTRVVNIGPKMGDRTNPHQLCIRGKFLLGDLTHHPSRITVPMIRRKDKWIEVSWDEAIGYTSAKLEKHRGKAFGMLCSEQDSLEENHSLQAFCRRVMKSENIDLVSVSYDKGLLDLIDSLLSRSSRNADPEKADTLLLLGTDASITHPLLEKRIRKAYNNGTRVLYINNVPTRTSLFSDHRIIFGKGKESLTLYVLVSMLAQKTIPGLPAGFAEQLSDAALAKALKSCTVPKGDLEALVSSLEASRNLCVVAGGSFTKDNTAGETIKALGNILLLKNGKSRCGIILPEFEGNAYGSRLIGVDPGVGLPRDEMIANIGREGISALLVAGDIPPVHNIKKLKFLVQLNMFRTGVTEFADVFLPVTGLLENDGHFLSLDGKIKKVRRAVPPPGNARTIPSIISALAAGMGQSGLTVKPASIWKEIGANVRPPGRDTGKTSLEFRPLNPAIAATKPGKPGKPGRKVPAGKTVLPGMAILTLGMEYPANGHTDFLYRGNAMTGLIPDLYSVAKTLTGEKQ